MPRRKAEPGYGEALVGPDGKPIPGNPRIRYTFRPGPQDDWLRERLGEPSVSPAPEHGDPEAGPADETDALQRAAEDAYFAGEDHA